MKPAVKETLIKCLIAAAVVVAVLGVHRMSYDDELNAYNDCLNMAAKGVWPVSACGEIK